jgi:hypothetical protein
MPKKCQVSSTKTAELWSIRAHLHIPFSKHGKTFTHQSVAQALLSVQSSDELNPGKITFASMLFCRFL